jgi:hypothetical protein
MGAIRGSPVELVKCETSDFMFGDGRDRHEGMLGLDPEAMSWRVHSPSSPAMLRDRAPKPAIVTITIATIRFCVEPSKRFPAATENAVCSGNAVCNCPECADRAGVPG